ncbi:uncharacterized protein LOC132552931 [Ylistrum balloti]|uniref:uncharacterized protein LOC132552931 n=1 Tax=Ylistrum balloti TaxID=509963 RepID=UPI0029057F99|nr:uncharacterized protein LOC132552931 [Ylistrum balloti]
MATIERSYDDKLGLVTLTDAQITHDWLHRSEKVTKFGGGRKENANGGGKGSGLTKWRGWPGEERDWLGEGAAGRKENDSDGEKGTLITKPNVKGMLGGTVDLECTFQPTETWYVMQWRKRLLDDGEIILVNLPPKQESMTGGLFPSDVVLSPTWADNNLKSRGRTYVGHNATSINFNIKLYDFECTDVGTYICVVTGSSIVSKTTEVGIVAVPGKPSINSELMIVEENFNFTLECVVSLGIPPAEVTWYVKYPNDQDYTLITSMADPEEQSSETCVPVINQQIMTSITEETSGSIFQCRVEGPLIENENHQYNDEIIVETPEPIVTEAPYEVPCTGKNCNVNKTAALEFNGAESKPSVMMTMIACLIMFVSTFALR